MNAGPRNGQIRVSPRVSPSSERRAARLTAASPGSTSSGSTSSLPPRLSPGAGGPESSPGRGSTSPTSSSATTDPHALGELGAERVGAIADLDDHGPAEWLSALDHKTGARLDRAVGEISQHRCIAVRDAGEDAGVARPELGERHRVIDAQRQVTVGNRITVRIDVGLAELRGNQLLELFRDVVLEDLRLLMHPVPRHAEDLGQEELDQPVVADHLERDALALGRQT